MYKIRNRSNQELPVTIIKNGKEKRVFLLSKERVETEKITKSIMVMEERKLIKIMETEEEEEGDIFDVED